MVEYVLAIAAFLAALVGIAGKTREKKKSGLTNFTGLGWFAVAIAASVLVISIYINYQKDREAEKIAQIAYSQTLKSVHGLLIPFVLIRADIAMLHEQDLNERHNIETACRTFVSSSIESLLNPNHFSIFELLIETDSYVDLITYNFEDSPSIIRTPQDIGTRETWRNVFFNTTVQAYSDIENTLAVYRSVMSSETVEKIESLRNQWLVQRFNRLTRETDGDVAVWFRLHDTEADVYLEFLRRAQTLTLHLYDALESQNGT